MAMNSSGRILTGGRGNFMALNYVHFNGILMELSWEFHGNLMGHN